MPFAPLSQPIALDEIGRMLPPGATLLAGAIRVDAATDQQPRRVYNTLLGFQRGEPAIHVATYDKTHLVPFGEYLPFAGILDAIGLRELAAERGGFASGPEPRQLIDIPGIGKIAPLICYEAIFPTRVVQSNDRPRALVVVTNDGWFGNTTGPRQHFHMARVRAVEEGIPVIRSANNGISGIIDPLGSVIANLALDVRGTIDASIPPAVSSTPLYARVGDRLFALMALLLAVWLGFRYRWQQADASFRNEN
jgi:apolipoprotein N-acyltransferase